MSNGADISGQGYRILVGAGLHGESVRVEEADRAVRVYSCWKQVRGVPVTELRKDRLL